MAISKACFIPDNRTSTTMSSVNKKMWTIQCLAVRSMFNIDWFTCNHHLYLKNNSEIKNLCYTVLSLLKVTRWTFAQNQKFTYTLKRLSNWPLYKIWYYATYLINATKVWLLFIVHNNLSNNGKKKTCPCTKLSMWNSRCEKRFLVFFSKQRAKYQMACKKSGFKSYRPLVGPIEMLGLCTAVATNSQGAYACFFIRHVQPFHNSILIDTFYQWVQGTLLYMRHQVNVQNIEIKLNTTRFDLAVFVLRVPMLTL